MIQYIITRWQLCPNCLFLVVHPFLKQVTDAIRVKRRYSSQQVYVEVFLRYNVLAATSQVSRSERRVSRDPNSPLKTQRTTAE